MKQDIIPRPTKCPDLGATRYEGGLLGFPQYGVALDVRQGDFCAVNVHEWHCNTRITPSIDNTRIAPSIGNTRITPSIDNTRIAPSIDNTRIAPSIGNTRIAPSIGNTRIAPSIGNTKITSADNLEKQSEKELVEIKLTKKTDETWGRMTLVCYLRKGMLDKCA